ncbi:MAG TPA: MBL fold metallo-hydrolase [Acidimicrobiales bacterium]|nr:MBL fold metallo-hydrolase [Acidimicrobiales bacterium]
MRIAFHGVRGSTPAPGVDFVRYGGNTSCVTVARDGDDPRLVLDAGTGLANFSAALGGRPFRGTILLGHLHWDHTHGLPFFPAGGRPDSEVRLVMPAQGDPEEVLRRVLSPPHFPIVPSQLGGAWAFASIEEGEHDIEGFRITAREIPHKGGRTFGYRISDGSSTLAYLSDHSPVSLGPGDDGDGPYHDAALALTAGADAVIHDAQYTRDDFHAKADFGHSTIDYAIGLGERAGTDRLILFHHDPSRTDDELDVISAQRRTAGIDIVVAQEGMTIELGTPRRRPSTSHEPGGRHR